MNTRAGGLEPEHTGNGTTAGGEITGGRYSLSGDTGVSPGKKTVRITAVRKTGRRILAGPPEPPDKMVDEIERYFRRLAEEADEQP